MDERRTWLRELRGLGPALSLDGKLPATRPSSGHETWKCDHSRLLPLLWLPQSLCWSLFNRTFCTSAPFPSSLCKEPCACELIGFFWVHVLILTRLVPPGQELKPEPRQAALGCVDGPGLCPDTHTHTHTHSCPGRATQPHLGLHRGPAGLTRLPGNQTTQVSLPNTSPGGQWPGGR